MACAHIYTVRVRLLADEWPDGYFDITNVDGDSEGEAIGYAISLATECFGLPLRRLVVDVISTKTIIDC